ncbi:hypothetical protein [Stratiformator vulcanicus]|uniref:Uncharacterized protein n=1 Tax=Stratiformator vulcanicus TaxID=2527980 RepID=A0A517R671_9PLAN|nr:hypothetical protein [Stratiformator vulcanicus]QDT39397.1 hypothetical protein Pan189_38040 [Stratiformator vulcanicus]
MKKDKDEAPRGEVILRGLNPEGGLVVEVRLDVFKYYEELHELLDDGIEYRSSRNITFVTGEIYDYEGKKDQEFTNFYGSDGTFIRNEVKFF